MAGKGWWNWGFIVNGDVPCLIFTMHDETGSKEEEVKISPKELERIKKNMDLVDYFYGCYRTKMGHSQVVNVLNELGLKVPPFFAREGRDSITHS